MTTRMVDTMLSDERYNRFMQVIDSLKLRDDELIVYLTFCLKQKIRDNVKTAMGNVEYTNTAIKINNLAKDQLTDTIRVIDSKRNVLKSTAKQYNRNRRRYISNEVFPN